MIKIHWWTLYGRHSCHRNEPGLSFDESLLAVTWETDAGWVIQLRDQEIQEKVHRNLELALRAIEAAVGGEQVQTWD